jgi:nucleoside-diphosphate-sugar epimerase
VNQPILVTGGSGTLGRGVVARLLTGGHQVRVLSRRRRPTGVPAAVGWATGDLCGGDGLAARSPVWGDRPPRQRPAQAPG